MSNVTPDGVHKATSLAAIAAGKHILCEKPLATNAEDAHEMAAAAQAANVINMVNLSYRDAPAIQHARALITAGNPGALAQKIIDRGLSVRETEQLVRKQSQPGTESQPRSTRPQQKDADTRALESDLSSHLGMRVQIDHLGQDGGKLIITYRDLDQLDALCQHLGGHS